jgi:hypothetical protein
MFSKRSFPALWFAVLAFAAVGPRSPGQQCKEQFTDIWIGGQGLEWAQDANWSRGIAPHFCDHVYFTFGGYPTYMDLQDTFQFGRRILSLNVESATALPDESHLELGPAAGYDDPVNGVRYLYVKGDAVRSGAPWHLLNDYTVRLGQNDRVYVGDPHAETGAGSTWRMAWMLDGTDEFGNYVWSNQDRPLVSVRDFIGSGRWDVIFGIVIAGYREDLVDPFFFHLIEDDAVGRIDPRIDGGDLDQSLWYLDGAVVRAKCGYAHRWFITAQCGDPSGENCPNTGVTNLSFWGGLRAKNVEFWGRRATVGNASDVLRIHFNDNYFENECDAVGLALEGGRFTIGSPEVSSVGPRVLTERIFSIPGALLTLQDGARLEVRRLARSEPDLVTFGGGALRYGRWEYDDFLHARLLDNCCDGFCSSQQCDPACVEPCAAQRAAEYSEPFLTTFRVEGSAVEPRAPKIHFYPGAVLTTYSLTTPDPRMRLETATHLDVETLVSQPPMNSWDTSGVDLVILPPMAPVTGDPDCGLPLLCPPNSSGCAFACSDEDASYHCPVQVEAFAPDVGNVWFTDLPGRRCIKHWRSLTLTDGADMGLVDRHRNDTVENRGPPPRPEAMYVLGDVTLSYHSDASRLHLNGLTLYYGGELRSEGFQVQPLICGSAVPLLKTEYGDFNGDCVIDDADFALLAPPDGPSPTPVPLANPLFDFDGDCAFGPADYAVFMSRYTPGVTTPVACSWPSAGSSPSGSAAIGPPAAGRSAARDRS